MSTRETASEGAGTGEASPVAGAAETSHEGEVYDEVTSGAEGRRTQDISPLLTAAALARALGAGESKVEVDGGATAQAATAASVHASVGGDLATVSGGTGQMRTATRKGWRTLRVAEVEDIRGDEREGFIGKIISK